MEILIHTMETGVALAVSTGSFSQDMGAAVWTIEGVTSAGQCIASNVAWDSKGGIVPLKQTSRDLQHLFHTKA